MYTKRRGRVLSSARRTLWLLRTLPPVASWWLLRRSLERSAARRERLAQALNGATGRLVFVCHGNIMRSAFCAEVARHEVPEHAARIVSGGTHASLGSGAEATALEVARAFDVDLRAHRSSPLDELALNGTDVVVCMDRGNEALVLQFLGQGERVFLVGDIDELSAGHGQHGAAVHGGQGSAAGETAPGAWVDTAGSDDGREVSDPYGKGPDVTRRAFLRLRSRAELWALRHFGHSQAQP